MTFGGCDSTNNLMMPGCRDRNVIEAESNPAKPKPQPEPKHTPKRPLASSTYWFSV